MSNVSRFATSCLLGAALIAAPAFAQQGSKTLPPPAPKFKGKIGRTYKESKPDKIPIIKAPTDAPNILMILIDDSGFGQWGTFGGQVPTPNLDRLAQNGLRYTRFHTTALCSPSRAALLTGRNHHSCGMGNITELADSYPGYSSQIPKSCGMVSETLRQNGYSTAYFGKNHQIADWETSISGPFDRWPSLQGFDHFYGFIGGESNQWQPPLYKDTQPVEMEIPKGREHDYTLNESLADHIIEYVHHEKAVTPDRPFFIYYAPGATHAPHHVPQSWMAKFRGKFDQGWDKYREETFERQKKLGVIPPDAKLTPRPAEIPPYDSLSPNEKKVAVRLMEAFAAYTAQTDYQVGRVLDELQAMGLLENTLVIWEVGDNGSSMEGGLTGTFNEMITLGGMKEDPAITLQKIDEIGGPKSYNHFPVGWAWAMNTPFQWGKQVASHFGGTRNPVVISWPKRIKDKGAIRTQFAHIIDIAPTIIEAAGVTTPTELNGVKQKPLEGVSMAYSFDAPNAKGRHRVQYFEMLGNRGLYADGWVASARHGRLPWETGNATTRDFADDKWELYHIDEDFSESVDVAERHPKKLKELQDKFWVEAKKYNVLPLDDRFLERLDPAGRPSLIEGRTDFVFYPGAYRIPESSAPNTKNRSHTLTATFDVPTAGADGVLVAEGGVAGGYSLFVQDGRPYYEYNLAGQKRFVVSGKDKLPPGPNVVRLDFKYDGGGIGKGGTATLFVNNKKVGETRIDATVPGRFSADETFDTGRDTGASASDRYRSPFVYTGGLRKVEVKLAPSPLTDNEREDVRLIERQILQRSE